MVRIPRSFTLLVVTTFLALLMVAPASATTPTSIIKAVNAERTARGLAPLQPFGDNSMAKRSNDAFVTSGELHGLFSEAAAWYRNAGATSVAENQAMFPASTASGSTVASAWADSKGHAANQFNPDATHIAAAVRASGSHVFYTVHIVRATSHRPPETSEPQPSKTTKPPPPPPKPPPAPEQTAPAPPAPEAQTDPATAAGDAVPDPEPEASEPRVIATPQQMTVVPPAPPPATPRQLRSGTPTKPTSGAVRRANLPPADLEQHGHVEVAVLDPAHQAVRASLAAGPNDQSGAGFGFTGLGGAVGLAVLAVLRSPRRRAGRNTA